LVFGKNFESTKTSIGELVILSDSMVKISNKLKEDIKSLNREITTFANTIKK